MLENLFPTAHAQSVSGTVGSAAQQGGELAVSSSTAGIESLLTYVATNVDNWIAGAVIIFIFFILAGIASRAIKNAIMKEKEDIQESALILIDRVTRITVVAVGITIALAINGLNFTAVVGALSLGIGFALKDIIGNFLSGVIMLSQNRIRIGDFVKVNEILGTITNIDTRATILQSIDGSEVVIPNQTMLSETLISYSTNPFRRVELIVGVDYKTNLPLVTSLIKGIIDKDPDIVPNPEPLILVNEFGDSSINIKILFWVESSNNWMKVRSNLANRIKKAFDRIGVSIPFPIRTLKLDEDDRSFLKTMDSMKKGIVPEIKPVPDMQTAASVASETENEQYIPVELFNNKKQEAQHPTEIAMQNQPAAPEAGPNPPSEGTNEVNSGPAAKHTVAAAPTANVPPVAPAQNAQPAPAEEQKQPEKEKVGATPAPPPSHL
jgi:small-conductance mechanosensitive channel